ncbi:uncharacterized protein LOC114155779 isoform X4 [Xiphophorus couchianus]|uniref:uncharacterized protein LOC114155779 isoform X4 n=1 Tax=Xiphophorus couchianus TaxID=32473 RepID=UPI0010163FA9|nr:uncharacterized protein LOC114155779 isoform X4 [Xiphophorus couchianus]
MSSVPPQRELINKQFIPAEETLTEFYKIIVKSEEEMDDHRKLLDFSRLPQIILHRIDVPVPGPPGLHYCSSPDHGNVDVPAPPAPLVPLGPVSSEEVLVPPRPNWFSSPG